MRIISGKLKGRNIQLPKGSMARPTPERIREAVFNIISGEVMGSTCVDLFAGSGAMGIEALSRGARYVAFADKWLPAAQSIAASLKAFGVEKSCYDVSAGDFTACAPFLQRHAPIDIAFLDPPYHEGYYDRAIEFLSAYMGEGSLIVAESDAAERLCESCYGFTCEDSRKYGSSRVWFFRKG